MQKRSNGRIARNVLFMYCRMFLMMAVSLYTSRVVLRALGIDDFGIYNIVGGIVVLFSFINNAMASATQRHISYELGREDGNVSKIYSACYNIHVWIAAAIFVLCETAGLWLLNNKLNIPADRMTAANWVYQFSVVTCILNIIRVPDNAAVISYEYMSFYAYTGIVEAVLKLLTVCLLLLFSTDKLVLYGFMLMLVTGIINIVFVYYRCHRIPELRYVPVRDKAKYRELLSFSTWTLLGSMANMGRAQGINIIVNMFYGVGLNAAIGIANQINSQITNLVASFQQALNPQLTMAEASKDREYQFKLICRSSRFSFLIMYVVIVPILLNIDYILALWLGEYPKHTASLSTIIIIGALIETLSGPLWVTLYATGRIKVYQIVTSSVLLLILPISYIGGRMGMTAEIMFIICNVLLFTNFLVRLYFMRMLLDFDVALFCRDVLVRISLVLIVSGMPILLIPSETTTVAEPIRFLIVSGISFLFILCVAGTLGLQKAERVKLINVMLRKINIR